MDIKPQRRTFAGRVASYVPLRHMVLALFAGGAQAFSMASPFGFLSPLGPAFDMDEGASIWWVQLLAVSLLAGLLSRQQDLYLSARQRWKSGALTGWLFAMAWLACTFWWTFVALHTYGGLPAVLGVLAVLSLAGLLALYYAAACGLFVLLAPVNRNFTAIVFASLWLLAELARGVWFTGFGWGAAGYAHVEGPLAVYAPWVGVYGLCFISAWFGMTLMWRGRVQATWRWQTCGFKFALLACVLGLPYVSHVFRGDTSTSTVSLSVTLLQGNIPQDEKFESGSGVPLALQWYADQLVKGQTALIVAPETAIPLLPQQLAPDYWAGLQQRFSSGSQAALIGMPLGNFEVGYTNSVLGLKPGQLSPWRYDKHHLVPFGEFIPPLFKWFTELMHIPLGDFNRGALRQPPFEWQGQRLATNVCYEDLFGEELGQQFLDPLRAPTIFVNVSNLAWFGSSVAMDQHLQIARMRALEFERPFVLATNTGVTAIVDHKARVVSRIPRDIRGVLVGEVEGRTGITPFAAWISRFGLWPYWLLALCGVGFAARIRLQRR